MLTKYFVVAYNPVYPQVRYCYFSLTILLERPYLRARRKNEQNREFEQSSASSHLGDKRRGLASSICHPWHAALAPAFIFFFFVFIFYFISILTLTSLSTKLVLVLLANFARL